MKQILIEATFWFVLTFAAALVGVALIGCRNDAITYAKAIAPDAECSAVETTSGFGGGRGIDTAVCHFEHAVWLCTAYNTPECKKIRDQPAEAKP